MGIFDNKKKKDQNKIKPVETKETPKPVEKQPEPVPVSQALPPAAAPKPVMSCVYGPVGSWRFGRALGIDLLCTEERTCNFDCVYCRFPTPGKVTTERQEFVGISKLFDDTNAVKDKVSADWVVFAGMVEPTLATNLGEAITLAKSIFGKPVAVLTNGSFLNHKEVRKALSQADMVVLKLDAFDDASFDAINRPSKVSSLDKMVQQWQIFRLEYKGKLAISIMANELNKSGGHGLRFKSMLVIPDQIQLNTTSYNNNVKPLSQAELKEFKQWFWNSKELVTVYDKQPPVVEPLDAKGTEKRHPTRKPGVQNPKPV